MRPRRRTTSTTAPFTSPRAAECPRGQKDMASVRAASTSSPTAPARRSPAPAASASAWAPARTGAAAATASASAAAAAATARPCSPHYGGTKHTERAVTGALVWLANHQMPDGSWSLQHYTQRCKDGTLHGHGQRQGRRRGHRHGRASLPGRRPDAQDQGALPRQHRQRHQLAHPHQEANGNLAKDCGQPMYSHGLATIALCEAYGLSGDKNIGMAAQGRSTTSSTPRTSRPAAGGTPPASRATRRWSAGRSWP